MKKILLALCLLASVANGQLIISPPATAGVSGGGGDALVADPLSQFASTTSAQLATVMSDETGSGPLVFATAPSIAGGTHIGLTSLGIRSTGAAFDLTLASSEVLTAGRTLSLNVGNAARTLTLSGSPTLSGLTTTGTGTLALGSKNLTISNTLILAGTDSTTMTFPSTSATIARTDAANTFTGHQTVEGVTSTGATGTGKFVFDTAPTIAGGAHTALTGLGIRSTGAAFDLTLASAEVLTAGRTLSFDMGDAARTITLSGSPTLSGITTTGSGTLALGTKNLTLSNTLTLAGTDSTTMTFPTTSATIARTDAANTFIGTQTVGALVATTFNGNTWGTGTGTLSIAAGKTFTSSNTLTFTGTDSSSVAFGAGGTVLYSGGALGTPSSGTLTNATGLPVAGITASTSTALGVGSIELGAASDTTIARSGAGAITVEGVAVPTISSTNTFTNKFVTPRVTSISSNATWSPNADTDDVYEITAQAADATTISNPSGTPVNGQKLIIRATGTAARALTWSGSQWRASSDLTLPSTTTTTKTLYLGFIYNSTGPKWDLVAKLDNF